MENGREKQVCEARNFWKIVYLLRLPECPELSAASPWITWGFVLNAARAGPTASFSQLGWGWAAPHTGIYWTEAGPPAAPSI